MAVRGLSRLWQAGTNALEVQLRRRIVRGDGREVVWCANQEEGVCRRRNCQEGECDRPGKIRKDAVGFAFSSLLSGGFNEAAAVGNSPRGRAGAAQAPHAVLSGPTRHTSLRVPSLFGDSGRVRRHQVERHGLRDFDAVDGRRIDATRVARAFAGRIESCGVHALVVVLAANPDR